MCVPTELIKSLRQMVLCSKKSFFEYHLRSILFQIEMVLAIAWPPICFVCSCVSTEKCCGLRNLQLIWTCFVNWKGIEEFSHCWLWLWNSLTSSHLQPTTLSTSFQDKKCFRLDFKTKYIKITIVYTFGKTDGYKWWNTASPPSNNWLRSLSVASFFSNKLLNLFKLLENLSLKSSEVAIFA